MFGTARHWGHKRNVMLTRSRNQSSMTVWFNWSSSALIGQNLEASLVSGPITSNQQGDCDLEFHSTAHANLCSENQLERPFAFWSIITDNNSEPNNAGVRRGRETVLLLNSPGCIFTPLHGKFGIDEVQVWEHFNFAQFRPKAFRCAIVQHSFWIRKHFGGFDTLGNEVERIWQPDVLAADLTECPPSLHLAAH